MLLSRRMVSVALVGTVLAITGCGPNKSVQKGTDEGLKIVDTKNADNAAKLAGGVTPKNTGPAGKTNPPK